MTFSCHRRDDVYSVITLLTATGRFSVIIGTRFDKIEKAVGADEWGSESNPLNATVFIDLIRQSHLFRVENAIGSFIPIGEANYDLTWNALSTMGLNYIDELANPKKAFEAASQQQKDGIEHYNIRVPYLALLIN